MNFTMKSHVNFLLSLPRHYSTSVKILAKQQTIYKGDQSGCSNHARAAHLGHIGGSKLQKWSVRECCCYNQ